MLQVKSGTQRVSVVQMVGAIGLPSKGGVLLEGVLGDAVEQQIAGPIRFEVEAGISAGQGTLPVERALGVLPAQDAVLRQLVLVLIQIVTEELALAVRLEYAARPQAGDAGDAAGLQTTLVGNLVLAVEGAEHQ